MKAVFLRELRENAKWAGAIFVVILIVVYSLIRRRSPNLMYALAEPPMLVFAPLAGLLLGVVQTLFETKADNWAFVVHRPVSRRQIFAAKTLAGLTLLYGASDDEHNNAVVLREVLLEREKQSHPGNGTKGPGR